MLGNWAWYWWPVIAGTDVLHIRDLSLYAAPMKWYWAQRILDGELPFWTPYVSAGMPFLADASNQVFYPLNPLVLLGDSPWQGVSYFVVAHLLLAQPAFYALARALRVSRWVALWGALLYSGSGYVISISDNVNFLPGVVWVPLGLACFILGLRENSPRMFAVCSLCLAALVLAGDTLNAPLMVLTMMVYGACASWSRWAAGGSGPLSLFRIFVLSSLVVLVAILLCAPQILPTLELVALSERQEGLGYEEIVKWSFPPQRTLELVQPLLFGSRYPALEFFSSEMYPDKSSPWVDSVYIGALPVFLALTAAVVCLRRATPWLLMLTLSLALSFGRHLPGFHELVSALPSALTQRYPEKLVFLATLSICVLSTLALSTILHERRSAVERGLSSLRAFTRVFYTLIIVGLVIAFSLLIPAQHLLPEQAQLASAYWISRTGIPLTHLQGLLGHATIYTIFVCTLFWLKAQSLSRYAPVLMALCVLDLAWVHSGHTPTAPSDLFADEVVAGAARHAHGDGRVYFDEDALGTLFSSGSEQLWSRVHTAYAGQEDRSGMLLAYATLLQFARLNANSGIIGGVRYLNGEYAPLQPAAHIAFDEALISEHATRLMQLSGVATVVTARDGGGSRWITPDTAITFDDEALNTRFLTISRRSPRFYISHANQGTRSLAEELELLSSEDFDPLATTLIRTATDQALESSAVGQKAKLDLIESTPEHYEFSIRDLDGSAYLVLNESNFPGWQARVDGEPTPVETANGRFMGVQVSARAQRVVLEYHSTDWTLALGLCAAGAILCLGLACGLLGRTAVQGK